MIDFMGRKIDRMLANETPFRLLNPDGVAIMSQSYTEVASKLSVKYCAETFERYHRLVKSYLDRMVHEHGAPLTKEEAYIPFKLIRAVFPNEKFTARHVELYVARYFYTDKYVTHHTFDNDEAKCYDCVMSPRVWYKTSQREIESSMDIPDHLVLYGELYFKAVALRTDGTLSTYERGKPSYSLSADGVANLTIVTEPNISRLYFGVHEDITLDQVLEHIAAETLDVDDYPIAGSGSEGNV